MTRRVCFILAGVFLLFDTTHVAAQTGPVAAYSMDEGVGTSLADLSGNQNAGTVLGATWTAAGQFGSALVFDGIDDMVSVPDSASLDLSDGMTLQAWVFPTTTNAKQPALWKEASGGLAYALLVSEGGARPSVRINVDGERSLSGASALPLNSWSHLAATYDGLTLRLFVNGMQVGERAVTGSILTSQSPLGIGSTTSRREAFRGRLDNIRIYNRALTPLELQADMNGPALAPPAADTIAPIVSITGPTNGTLVAGTTTISADATDDVGVVGVQFFVDGIALGAEDLIAPYGATWHSTVAANGAHVLTALARDAAGNRTTSAAVSVTVNNDLTRPTVAITAPTTGETISGSLDVTATAGDDIGVVGVQFFLDGASLGAEDLIAPYTVWWDTTAAADGTHSLTAIARDAAGNRMTSAAVSVTVDNRDITAPTVIITTPPAGATVSSSVAIDAAATDNVGVGGVQFFVDGVALGAEDLVAPYGASWNTTTTTNGLHSLTAVARDAHGNRTTSAAVSVTVDNDVTVPTVVVTAPAAGATISDTVTVSASATDNVGVVGVQFFVDGVALGVEDLLAPYSVAWNTTTVTTGSHSLSAVARDAAGNRGTAAAVNVNVSNVVDPTAPSVIGRWDAPFDWPVVAVHMTLMHTGDVLSWDDEGDVSLWTPATNTFAELPGTTTNLFCSSQSALADGRILVAGGHDPANLGASGANIFDPVTRQWNTAARMAFRRWYPTSTTLSDGRVIVIGGAQTCLTCIAEIPEIYNPITNTWTQLSAARINLPLYPYDYLLPDGRIITAGANEGITVTRALNLGTEAWTTVDPVAVDGGSSAMYRPGRIIKSGSWSRNTDLPSVPTSTTTYVIDMNSATPAWRQTASMAFPRAHHNLTLLPDGTVIVTGGERMSDGIDVSQAVFEAELWSPTTETWRTLAAMTVPRLYHGSALLLPDARVLVSGSGGLGGAVDQLSAEIYSPPYLFKGARPTITSAPARVDYGTAFDIQTPEAASIVSVSLIRPGSVTHTFDRDQRFLELTFRQTSGGLSIDAPANANLAPPGYYMLFILNGNGVPSVARFVRLPSPAEDAQAPAAPADLAAQGGIGAVSLTWTAATDNTGVASYNIHRSTAPGFAPVLANRIAQVTATSFVDAGRAAGTYFYVVTAQDVVGNVSAPSNESMAIVTGDVTAPAVSVTAPASGDTLTGVVTLSAAAGDDAGVAGVQFRMNGLNVGSEDTAAPFAISWNSSTVPNGTHTITAVARDATGNSTESVGVLVTVSNTQAPAGLVAAYNFDEASGLTAADRSGNGNTGTIAGATRVAGHTGGALSFDGVNDWMTVNDAPSLAVTSAMTLEAWVFPTTPADWRTVILKEGVSGLTYALYGSNDAGRPAGYVRISSDIAANGTAALPINTWSHLALTFDGAAVRLYVNGTLSSTATVAGTIESSALPLRVGGNSVWGEFFGGRIDDVRIYNRALGAAEVLADMATPVP